MKHSMLIKTVILFQMFSFAAMAETPLVSAKVPYYGDDFYNSLNAGVANQDLLNGLKQILRSGHVPATGANDRLVASCEGKKSCYVHFSYGYDQARKFLMGKFYLTSVQGEYGVRDVYCQHTYTESEFGRMKPGPNQIPDNKILNAEHTWPQSRFSTSFPKDIQKSDMHHLYPVDSHLNSVRGNNEFGEVTQDRLQFDCNSGARFGTTSTGRVVFEPPAVHKGNVARSIFYFSMRYDLPIGDEEEATLRKWNHDDPVDAEEKDRNEKIMALQGDRNPFVDFPELVDRIDNF